MKFILFSLFVALFVHLNDAEPELRLTDAELSTPRSQGLIAHNTYRKLHQAPALTLDSNINNIAKTYAEYLAAKVLFQHSTNSGYGENLYVQYTTATPSAATAVKNAVDSWYNEVKSYNYNQPGFSSATGHFTQVVWKSTTKLGLGVAFGKKTINGVPYNAVYVVANYSPPGNYQGQFPGNVLKPL